MGEMIEKVCRAMCVSDGLDPDGDWTSAGSIRLDILLPPGDYQRWRTYISKARAAIEALRKPTGELIAATAQAVEDSIDSTTDTNGSYDVWNAADVAAAVRRAFLDAILTEGEG